MVRGCYLGLRRAVHSPALARTTAAVLLEEPGRSLAARDVSEVLDIPVLARVPVKHPIARAVDAGVLSTRLPEPLARAAAEARAPAGYPDRSTGQGRQGEAA